MQELVLWFVFLRYVVIVYISARLPTSSMYASYLCSCVFTRQNSAYRGGGCCLVLFCCASLTRCVHRPYVRSFSSRHSSSARFSVVSAALPSATSHSRSLMMLVLDLSCLHWFGVRGCGCGTGGAASCVCGCVCVVVCVALDLNSFRACFCRRVVLRARAMVVCYPSVYEAPCPLPPFVLWWFFAVFRVSNYSWPWGSSGVDSLSPTPNARCLSSMSIADIVVCLVVSRPVHTFIPNVEVHGIAVLHSPAYGAGSIPLRLRVVVSCACGWSGSDAAYAAWCSFRAIRVDSRSTRLWSGSVRSPCLRPFSLLCLSVSLLIYPVYRVPCLFRHLPHTHPPCLSASQQVRFLSRMTRSDGGISPANRRSVVRWQEGVPAPREASHPTCRRALCHLHYVDSQRRPPPVSLLVSSSPLPAAPATATTTAAAAATAAATATASLSVSFGFVELPYSFVVDICRGKGPAIHRRFPPPCLI